MLKGWTWMYSKLAGANYVIGDENAAVHWIKKGLAENPKWSVNLPTFYFLKDHKELKSTIKPETFTTTDWENAMEMLSNLGRELEVIDLAKELIARDIESSYLNFLLGRSYFYEKEQGNSVEHLEKALKMDKDNIEAENLLRKIRLKK